MMQELELELSPRDVNILFALIFEPAGEEEIVPIDLLVAAGSLDWNCSLAAQ